MVAVACPNGTAVRAIGSDRKRSTTPRLLSRASATMDGRTFTAVVANSPGTRNAR